MRWIALLLVTVALAGCFGGDSGGGDDGSDSTGTSTSSGTRTSTSTSTSGPPDDGGEEVRRIPMLIGYGWDDCSGAEALYHPDVATAQAALPDGYTAYSEAPFEGADAVATVQYLWVQCGTFSTTQTAINGTVYGHVSVRIEDPGNVTADTHWYRLRMLAGADILQQLWPAAGYEVYADAFNQTVQEVGPLRARTDALGGYSLQGTDAAPAEEQTGTVAYLTETPSGLLEWTGSFTVQRSTAPGPFTVAEGDPFAEAIGNAPDPSTETWFHDGSSFSDNGLWLLREA